MGKHHRRFRYTRQQGKTYVSCTRCGINLVPAPTSFDVAPLCRACTPRREISQRQHFAWLVSGLLAAEITVMGVILGRDGIAQMCRWVWDMVTPW